MDGGETCMSHGQKGRFDISAYDHQGHKAPSCRYWIVEISFVKSFFEEIRERENKVSILE
jgi:hypothetical protein